MRRLSKLSSPEDFDLEERREMIRNSRCRRYVGVALGLSLALKLPSLSTGLEDPIAILARVLGAN